MMGSGVNNKEPSVQEIELIPPGGRDGRSDSTNFLGDNGPIPEVGEA